MRAEEEKLELLGGHAAGDGVERREVVEVAGGRVATAPCLPVRFRRCARPERVDSDGAAIYTAAGTRELPCF
jgi:hypothetical protein